MALSDSDAAGSVTTSLDRDPGHDFNMVMMMIPEPGAAGAGYPRPGAVRPATRPGGAGPGMPGRNRKAMGPRPWPGVRQAE